MFPTLFIPGPPRMTGPAEPSAAEVVMLLHCDGADGSTTFTDSSTYNRAMTSYGSPALRTATKKYGTASLQTSVGNCIRTVDAPEWNLSNKNFTMECWFNPSAFSRTFPSMIGQRNTSVSDLSFTQYFYWDAGAGSRRMDFVMSNVGNLAAQQSGIYNHVVLNIGQWYHWAVSRNGDTLRQFLDGTLLGSAALPANYTVWNSSKPIVVGSFDDPPYSDGFFEGYIDEMRITIGTGRYTASFTPPAGPYPNP